MTKDRNNKGQFIKGFGFWTGKKRPGLRTSTTFKKGLVPWNKGLGKIKITKERLPKPTNQQLACACGCGELLWKYDKKFRERKFIVGHNRRREIDPKWLIRKRLAHRGKSGLEKRVEGIINKFNLPYKFVGNGKFFIERKNPDFVNTNGQKIAVEVYWKRHKDEFRKGGCDLWMKERTKIFKKYGWVVVFLESSEINEKIVLRKLKGGDVHAYQ